MVVERAPHIALRVAPQQNAFPLCGPGSCFFGEFVNNRPPVWKMVQEAVEHLGGKASYAAIKQFILGVYGEVNDSTMTCQIIVCSVNHPSRIHYPANKKPRLADSQYDFLFNTGRGQVEAYRPDMHGIWAIAINEYGKLVVQQQGLISEDGAQDTMDAITGDTLAFPLESHLRDFIARNLSEIRPHGKKLHLFQDADGRDGVEYPTGVGLIDILARDAANEFVVFELKLSKGPDYAVGQVLRYMGW